MIAQGFGDDNTARLTQYGDDNHAVITQAGQRNIVTALNQTGSSNYVNLVQQGDDNRATVDQQGNGNRLDLRQRDAFNVADISQHGGTDLTIVQSNPDGNVAAVNSLTLRSFTEPGSDPLIRSMSFDGPQARELFLCNGSAATANRCAERRGAARRCNQPASGSQRPLWEMKATLPLPTCTMLALLSCPDCRIVA